MQTYHYEIRYPSLTEGVFRIIVLFSITYLVQIIASIFYQIPYSELILMVHKNINFLSFFTHIFVYPVSISGFLNFLFEMLILWSFGSQIEILWGTRNFYKYFFIGIGGGLFWLLILGFSFFPGLYTMGISPAVTALLFAYGILYPNREVLFFFVLPLKMKWVVLILFIFLILGSLSNLIVNLGAAITSLFYLYLKIKKGKFNYEYQQYSNRSSSQVNFFQQKQEKESFLQKMKKQYEQFQKKRRLTIKQNEIMRRIEMKEEVDRILEKISREGMESLTRQEKKFLDKASKEL